MADFMDIKEITKNLGRAWKVGLSDREACVFAGITYEQFKLLVEGNPKVAIAHEAAQKNRVQDMYYSAIILHSRENMMNAVREGDVKSSRWVLEHIDNDFMNKSKQDVEVTIDDTEDRKAEIKKMLNDMFSKKSE